ncbi:MAG TPA: potassium transporter Kup [Polyangiaceae bacterium]|nr:potassium transporter Kup [Polyangiaceae bacterium]
MSKLLSTRLSRLELDRSAPASWFSGLDSAGAAQRLKLSLLALGVVYGDIGTSPLYALRECFHGHGVPVVQSSVLGVLSLIFWSLTSIVSVKYLRYVLNADNHGEGGILALMALALSKEQRARHRNAILALGIVGAALLYGDGAITPAISVLGAMEGLALAAPRAHALVVPGTVVILVALFSFQRRGTATVGLIFGPITLLWFVVLALLGLRQVVAEPQILKALNPWYGVEFLATGGLVGFGVLGAVFLAVTGGEALYADLGHFGRGPIRLAWHVVVWPALVLNYFGQGALLLREPAAAANPFFLLAPSWALYPLVALSTAATVIASQALITGVYSITRQASMLGVLPRVAVLHTSAQQEGQIYVPFVNWALLLATITLVCAFGSSSRLASAYGIAVTLSMLITTLLAHSVARSRGWSAPRALLVTLVFAAIELGFLLANVQKIAHGGWLPLLFGSVLSIVMLTWYRGRQHLAARFRQELTPVPQLLQLLERDEPVRVPGTAVFMTGSLDGAPPALLHNLDHNHVLHEVVVFLTIVTESDARVPEAARMRIEAIAPGIWRLVGRYGFMDQPDAQDLLLHSGLIYSIRDVTFFLGQQHLLLGEQSRLRSWRMILFTFLSRIAQPARGFFNIPPARVMEVGIQVVL